MLLTFLSVGAKGQSREVQKATAWELPAIATLKLIWWQKLQGGFVLITAISSLYLLSAIGVEADENVMIWIVGTVGVVSAFFAAIVAGVMLVRTQDEISSQKVTLEAWRELRSVRAFSSGECTDNMLVGAVM
ncbi:hypothetical protein TrST_g11596 [Triparma strigata]|uniref:Uncharacterized protein n=1 Tax=Triparma strigata TaxID=1606541 RepID=A0A9W7DVG1_9STRA|nr:hypothetical protein TrST_g11596 [Triparma strigata]